MNHYRVVIPARFDSSRLPGKALMLLAGKPMLQWVHERARSCAAAEVIIATDDERIASAARGFGAEVAMTARTHVSGTDRIAEVAAARGWADTDIVVNVQGDEPLIPPRVIDQVAELLAANARADIATLAAKIESHNDLADPNNVKVACDAGGRALYFSRAPIPFNRDAPTTLSNACLRHVGLYAYRVAALRKLASLPAARLELIEKLEQLRALENGMEIRVALAVERPLADVNTAADLERAERALLLRLKRDEVMSATLTGLHVYPIKSCRGIALGDAELTPTGLADDRHWMLVRPNGRFITQREYPRMALIATALNGNGVALNAPGMPGLEVSRSGGGESRAVTVWKFDGRGIDCGDAVAAWVSKFLETPLRLVMFDVSMPRVCSPEWTGETRAITEFSDGYPILVISRASLAELNSRLPRALPMERFRPNVVIDGVDAYDEDRMRELRAGPVTLRIVKPCTRCSITTTDQQLGAVDGVEPLRTLKEYRYDASLRGVAFGQNVIVVSGVGESLRVGQSFEVVWK